MNERQTKGTSSSQTRGHRAGGDGAPIPQLDGVKHYFVDLPGLKMHVAETGDGPPLLMLHGIPQHWWAWRKTIPDLARHHRVICPDLRGFGWTDAPRDGYDRDHFVADVVALLDALDFDRVCLVGYDLGGLVGYKMCLAHPDRIERFVSIAAPHPYPEFHARMLLSMWRVWPMFAIATPCLGPWLLRTGRQRLPRWLMESDTNDMGVWTARDLEIFVERLRDPARARAASAVYRELVLTETNRGMAGEYHSSRLSTPTLSLYGAVLYTTHNSSSEHPEILSGYENFADDFTLQHVPDSGYYLPEEQPEVVVASIQEFLGAQPHE